MIISLWRLGEQLRPSHRAEASGLFGDGADPVPAGVCDEAIVRRGFKELQRLLIFEIVEVFPRPLRFLRTRGKEGSDDQKMEKQLHLRYC